MITSSLDTLTLAQELISRPSITPKDEGCQQLIGKRLERLGFQVYALPFEEVENLWAIRGNQYPLCVFAGHTDVVPPGNTAEWDSPPFTPTLRNNYLFGRGAADMKGSLAAMVTACERFLKRYPNPTGSIGFLITSDEEGNATHGTAKVIEYLQAEHIPIKYCIIGEPTSHHQVGDIIKNGRRGSLSAHLKILGKQGHIAYPDKANNPIHSALKSLLTLVNTEWCTGDANFPKTSLQISNIHSGLGVSNVIPPTLECSFNFRFSTALTAEGIKERVQKILDSMNIQYHLTWILSGNPFLTSSGKLLEASRQAIEKVTGQYPKLSTDGGTSDGRFIKTTGAEIVEIGPCNHSIHSVNECIHIDDLNKLSLIYEELLCILFDNIIS